jgi:hypothetical protein
MGLLCLTPIDRMIASKGRANCDKTPFSGPKMRVEEEQDIVILPFYFLLQLPHQGRETITWRVRGHRIVKRKTGRSAPRFDVLIVEQCSITSSSAFVPEN